MTRSSNIEQVAVPSLQVLSLAVERGGGADIDRVEEHLPIEFGVDVELHEVDRAVAREGDASSDETTRGDYRRAMSQIYRTASEFEALFGQLFEQIESDDPDGMDDLIEQEMVIHFRINKPDVELWVDGRSKPVQTTFGPHDLDATLTAELTANSLHELLLGTLGLASAMLFRKLKVQGSKSKAMKLESLLHAMQAAYPELVADR